jgi:hypothetical protein
MRIDPLVIHITIRLKALQSVSFLNLPTYFASPKKPDKKEVVFVNDFPLGASGYNLLLSWRCFSILCLNSQNKATYVPKIKNGFLE